MIKWAKKQKKDPNATEDEKRIAGIVKRDLNNRSGHAYAIAKDAEESDSQEWFVEAAEDYVDIEKEERRKSG